MPQTLELALKEAELARISRHRAMRQRDSPQSDSSRIFAPTASSRAKQESPRTPMTYLQPAALQEEELHIYSLDSELAVLQDDRVGLLSRCEVAEQRLKQIEGMLADSLKEKSRVEETLLKMTVEARGYEHAAKDLDSARQVFSAEKELLGSQLAEARAERAELIKQCEDKSAAHASLSVQLAEAVTEKRGLEALAQQTEQRWRHWFKGHFAVEIKAAQEEKQALAQRAEVAEQKCEAARKESLLRGGEAGTLREQMAAARAQLQSLEQLGGAKSVKDAREDHREMQERLLVAQQERDRVSSELAALQTKHAVLAERDAQQASRIETDHASHSALVSSLQIELQLLRDQATADSASVVRLERENGQSVAIEKRNFEEAKVQDLEREKGALEVRLGDSHFECGALRERMTELRQALSELTAEAAGAQARLASAGEIGQRTEAWHEATAAALKDRLDAAEAWGEGLKGELSAAREAAAVAAAAHLCSEGARAKAEAEKSAFERLATRCEVRRRN